MTLAINWIEATEEQLVGKPLIDKGEAAVINLLELVSINPDGAVEVMLQIIEQKPTERVLNCLGAGPIEELLVDHPEYLEKLIATTHNASALKKCLLHANIGAEDGVNMVLLEKFLDKTPE